MSMKAQILLTQTATSAMNCWISPSSFLADISLGRIASAGGSHLVRRVVEGGPNAPFADASFMFWILDARLKKLMSIRGNDLGRRTSGRLGVNA